ncbi:MAG: transcriptional regulator [Myxococcota bacterium]
MLAHLADRGGGRVSPTARALGGGRRIVGDTFTHLVSLGLLARNPGHGHPLRPEFQLTPAGRPVSRWAAEFLQSLSPAEVDAVRRAWALPVLRLVVEPRSFGQLRNELVPVTDRALSLCLARLAEGRLVRHEPRATEPLARGSYLAAWRGVRLSATLQETYEFGGHAAEP